MSVSRFVALGGSSRRYLDRQGQVTISRRRFLKMQGIFPESRAEARRAAGALRVQRPRRDSGVAHMHPDYAGKPAGVYVKQLTLPSGKSAQVSARGVKSSLYRVTIANVPVGSIRLLDNGKRRKWLCEAKHCEMTAKHQYGMVLHCLDAHYLQACRQLGVSAE